MKIEINCKQNFKIRIQKQNSGAVRINYAQFYGILTLYLFRLQFIACVQFLIYVATVCQLIACSGIYSSQYDNTDHWFVQIYSHAIQMFSLLNQLHRIMTRGANIRGELSQVCMALEWKARGQFIKAAVTKKLLFHFHSFLKIIYTSPYE